MRVYFRVLVVVAEVTLLIMVVPEEMELGHVALVVQETLMAVVVVVEKEQQLVARHIPLKMAATAPKASSVSPWNSPLPPQSEP